MFTSFNTIEYNLTHSWVWDEDNFEVNQIGHPYQGSLYYSSAKYYGHNYYQSIPFTAFGSLQWEYFMETERPAVNDLITTTLGGVMLGEVVSRLSDRILDNSSTGWSRAFRETGAFLLDPLKGVNRLIDGSMFNVSSYSSLSKTKMFKFQISIEGKFGKILFDDNQDLKDSLAQVPIANTSIQMIYGNPFKVRKPFDHFTLNVGLSSRQDLVANVIARGILWQHSFRKGPKLYSSLGFVQNYDYVRSQTHKISANSIGLEYLAMRSFSTGWKYFHSYQAGFIIMGGASTEYFVAVERDYNLGPGFQVKLTLNLFKEDFGSISFHVDRYIVRTLSGAEGVESVGLGKFEFHKNIYKGFGLGGSYVFYDREGLYYSYPDVKVNNHEFRGVFTYDF